MSERTNELPDDAMRECIHACEDSNSTSDKSNARKARVELAALQSAAQGMTLDDTRKVLPARTDGDGWRLYSIDAIHMKIVWSRRGTDYVVTYHSTEMFATTLNLSVDEIVALRTLFAAMQGDSAEAVALREEYAA